MLTIWNTSFTEKSGVPESGGLHERTSLTHPNVEWKGRNPGPVLWAPLVVSAREREEVGTCLPVTPEEVTGQRTSKQSRGVLPCETEGENLLAEKSAGSLTRGTDFAGGGKS